MSAKNTVSVGIKMRPLLRKEKDESVVWKVENNSIQLIEGKSEQYCFDHIFDQDSSNKMIFDRMAKQIVHSSIQGFNGTIFAYGQTSSGKTYTMMGDAENPGVILLAFEEIFKLIQQITDRKFLIRVGYIEIYNEKLYDLLDKKNTDLKIHETPSGMINVTCKEAYITSEKELLYHFVTGNKERTVGETNMNERSSRSHAIFRIMIESKKIDQGEAVIQSVLHLVDLAGSERADQTGARGTRLIEGGHINKSLHFLSLVIQRLSENEDEKFISFRDSKLTRILQASLGGNALTAIICAIKPSAVEETLSTLNFALRAKTIKNKPIVNENVSDATMMRRLEQKIRALETDLELERRKNETQKSKIKVGELEQRLRGETHKIINNSLESKHRRRTWCPATKNPNTDQPSTSTNFGLPIPTYIGTPATYTHSHVLARSTMAASHAFLTPQLTVTASSENDEQFVPGEKYNFDKEQTKQVTQETSPTHTPEGEVRTVSITPRNTGSTREKIERDLLELEEFTNLENTIQVKHETHKAQSEALENLISRNQVLERERREHIATQNELLFVKEQLDKSEERCRILEAKTKCLGADNSDLVKAQLEVELEKYRTNLQETKLELETQKDELLTYKSQINVLEIAKSQFEDEILSFQKKLTEIKEINERLLMENRQVVSLDVELKNLKSKSQRRESELLGVISDKDKLICTLESKNMIRSSDLMNGEERKACVKCIDLQLLLIENKKVKDEFDLLTSEYEKLQQNLKSTEAEMAQIIATNTVSDNDSKFQNMHAEINALREKLQTLQSEYSILEGNKSVADIRNVELSQSVNAVQVELNLLLRKYEEVEQFWLNEKENVVIIQKQYDAIEIKYKDLEEKYKVLEESNVKSIQVLIGLERDNKSLQAEISDLKQQCIQAQFQILEIQEQHDKEIDLKRIEISKFEKQLEAAESQINKCIDRDSALNTENGAKIIDKLNAELMEKDQQLNEMQKEYDVLSVQLMDILQENEHFRIELNKLQLLSTPKSTIGICEQNQSVKQEAISNERSEIVTKTDVCVTNMKVVCMKCDGLNVEDMQNTIKLQTAQLNDLTNGTEKIINELRDNIKVLTDELLEKSQLVERCACSQYQKQIQDLEKEHAEMTILYNDLQKNSTFKLDHSTHSVSSKVFDESQHDYSSALLNSTATDKLPGHAYLELIITEMKEKESDQRETIYSQEQSIKSLQEQLRLAVENLEKEKKNLKEIENNMELALYEQIDSHEIEIRKNLRHFQQNYEEQIENLEQEIRILKNNKVIVSEGNDNAKQDDYIQKQGCLKNLEAEKEELSRKYSDALKILKYLNHEMASQNQNTFGEQGLYMNETCDLQYELSQLHKFCENMKNGNNLLFCQNKNLKSNLEMALLDNNRINIEIKELKNSVNFLEIENTHLKSQLEAALNEKKSVEVEVLRLKDLNCTLNDENRLLKKIVKDSIGSKKTSSEENEPLGRLSEAETQSLSSNFEDNETNILVKQYLEKLDESQQKLIAENKVLKSQLQEAKEEAKFKLQTTRVDNPSVSLFEKSNKSLIEEIEQLTHEKHRLNHIIKGHIDLRNNLQTDIDNKNLELDVVTVENLKIKSQIKELIDSNNSLQLSNEDLQYEIELKKTQATEAKILNDSIKNEKSFKTLKSQESEIEQNLKQIKSLKKTVQDLKDENENITTLLKLAEANYNGAKQQENKLKDELLVISKEYKICMKKIKSLEIDHNEQKIALENGKNQLELQYGKLKSIVAEREKTILELGSQNHELKNEISMFHMSCGNQPISDVNLKVIELHAKDIERDKTLEESLNKIKKLSEENRCLDNVLKQAKHSLERADEKIVGLEKLLEQFKKEAEKTEHNLKCVIADISAELEQTKAEVVRHAGCADVCKKLDSKIADLSKELSYTQKIVAKHSECKNLHTKMEFKIMGLTKEAKKSKPLLKSHMECEEIHRQLELKVKILSEELAKQKEIEANLVATASASGILDKQVLDLSNELQICKETIQQHNGCTAIRDQLEIKIIELSVELDEFTTIAEKHAECAEIHANLNAKITDLSGELHKIATVIKENAECYDAQTSLDSNIVNMFKELQNSKAIAARTITELEERLSGLSAEVERLTSISEINSGCGDTCDNLATVASLENENLLLRRQTEVLQIELDNVQCSSQNNIAITLKEKEEARLKLKNLQEENEKLQSQIESLKSQCENLIKDKQTLQEENDNNMISQKDSHLEEKSTLIKTIDSLTNEKLVLEKKLSTVQLTVTKLENELLQPKLDSFSHLIEVNQSSSSLSPPLERKSLDLVKRSVNVEDKLFDKKEKTIQHDSAERRDKRRSVYDERRRQSLWGAYRDVEVMTDPTDVNCACRELSEKVKELTSTVFIRDGQVAVLNMQLKNCPHKAENVKLRQRLQEEQESHRVEVKRFKQAIKDSKKTVQASENSGTIIVPMSETTAPTVLPQSQVIGKNEITAANETPRVTVEVSTQTVGDCNSIIHELESKNKGLRIVCRSRYNEIKKLESEISAGKQNENNTDDKSSVSSLELDQCQALKLKLEYTENELKELRRKYEDVKMILQKRKEEKRAASAPENK